MKITRFIFDVLLEIASEISRPNEPSQNFETARVLYVFDGDTVMVLIGKKQICLRLDSIDAPEDGQPGGDAAKLALIKLIGRQKISLECHGIDFYGRTLATIYREHKSKFENINERLVAMGHAWVSRKYYSHLSPERMQQLNLSERAAQLSRRGLWQDEKPLPPWHWRKKQSA